MKILYLYPSPRTKVLEGWKREEYPDTLLMGFNHLERHNIEGDYLDPSRENLWEVLFVPIERISKMKISQQIRSLSIINNYDVLVCKDLITGYFLSLLKKLGILRKPMVFLDVVIHEKIRGKKMLGLGLSAADKVVYCTGSLRNVLLNQFRVPESKLEYVPWAVDHTFFRPMDVEAKNFILSVGTNDRDYDTLLRTVAEIDIPLRIATSRSDIQVNSLKNVTKELLPPLQLKQAYGESKFVVVPLFDAASASGVTTLLESMAMEKATIISRSAGILDYVEDRKNAILVDSQNEKELKDAIIYLEENPEDAKKMGKHARKTVEEKFNTKKQADDLVEIYREVLE